MQYKLVKTYPLCPFELGAIATDDNVKSDVMLCIRTDVGRYTTYPKEAIMDNPEFWEEVKEKEYTILSYISNVLSDRFIYDGVGGYKSETLGTTIKKDYIEKSLTSERIKINSIQRKSDGEIFTLGDAISGIEGSRFMGYTISHFEPNKIHSNKIYLLNEDKEGVTLTDARKASPRKPILITEDKVKIFEGEICWYVNGTWYCGSTEIDKEIYEERKSHYKYYSTEKAAQEYIKWNKPMYSLNDVKVALDKDKITPDVIYELENLDRK